VASITVGDGHSGQGYIGNVVDTFSIGRWVSATVASRTLVGDRDLGVIPLGGLPRAGTVATHAVSRRGHVLAQLTRSCAAVVAPRTIGRSGVQAVVRLAASPSAGRFVARLADGLAAVDGSSGAAGQTIACAHMTAGALAGYRHTGMELGGRPARIATFMAGIAVGNGNACQ
jgi:hypothetical protein